MRISRLEIDNITSLKGKHVLDFDDGLQGEELFAITGPTGAGKSSLLSSISLALYGKTYKGSLASQDYVTTGAAYGRASLTFRLSGKEYIATWSTKILKKNGDPIKNPKPSREVICDGESLETLQMSEILGLDFDQFCKTIILNQGEFAKFLHSSFRERKDLIEKLYRTQELSKINKILKEKIKAQENDLSIKEVGYEKSLPYTEEEISKIKNQYKSKEVFLTIHESIQKFFLPLFENVKEINDLLSKESVYKNKLAQSEKNLLELTNDWNQSREFLKKAKAELETFKKESRATIPRLREAIQTKTILDRSKKELKEQLNYKQQASLKKKSLLNSLTQVEENLLESKNSYTEARAQIAHPKLFNQKTKNEIFNFKHELEKLKTYTRNDENYEKQIELLGKQVKTQKSSLLHCTEELKKIDNKDLNSNQSLSQLESERISELELWTSLNSHGENLAEGLRKIVQSEEKLKKCHEKKILLEKKVSEAEKQEIEIALKKALHLCKTIANKENECPVCHSEVDKLLVEDFDSLKDEKQEKPSSELERIQFEIQSYVENNKVIEESNYEKQKIVTALVNRLFPELKEDIKWNAPQEAQQGLKILKELHFRKKEEKQNYINELRQREQKVSALNNNMKNIESTLTELKEQVNEIELSKEKNQILLETFINNWKEILSSSKPLELIKTLDSDFESYNNILQLEQTIQSLDKEIVSLKEQNEDLNERVKKTTSTIEKLNLDIDEKGVELSDACGDKNPIELLEEIENKEVDLSKNHEALLKAFNTVEKGKHSEEQSIRIFKEQIEELQNLKIIKIGRTKELIIKERDNMCSALKNEEYPLFNWINQLADELKKWDELKDLHNSSELELILKSRLETFWEPLLEKFEETTLELKTSLATNKSKIEEFNKKLESRKDLEKELIEIKESLSVKHQLAEVFGKDEFRSYALGLLEKQLIYGANVELNTLCDGRYYLKLLPGKGSQMEFFIQDNWRESTLRKITTLSGGETFLVSLAMALALAELTRGQNEIDSFFIDEGFGHLDQDSIEEVLDVLMNIQNRGKQIGIISHVKVLTDRIPVNLNLIKSSLGESKVEFCYN